jgi:hypothetical protein
MMMMMMMMTQVLCIPGFFACFVQDFGQLLAVNPKPVQGYLAQKKHASQGWVPRS